jgi:hypothetical protein
MCYDVRAQLTRRGEGRCVPGDYKREEQAAGRTPEKMSQAYSKSLLFSACDKGGEVEKCAPSQLRSSALKCPFPPLAERRRASTPPAC